MAKLKRSKRTVNMEYEINGDYVTLTHATWSKGAKRWEEHTFVFNKEHLEYVQSLKGVVLPRVVRVMVSDRFTHFKDTPIIEFSYEVSTGICGICKNIRLNEICNYIGMQDEKYVVVSKGEFSEYHLDEHSMTFDTLDKAIKYLETLN